MPTFTAPDGTRLAYRLRGQGDPLVVLPGGPMRASAYLGDLGGLTAHRRLVLLDLRGTGASSAPADPTTYRCDRQTDDIEALRVHLGLERLDLLAHSAGGSLATLYAAQRPRRVGRLALISAALRPLGLSPAPADRLAAARLRSGEPWFERAYPALAAWLAGDGPYDDVFTPFFHGRWDEEIRAHADAEEAQTNEEAADRYFADTGTDPDATRAALAALTAPVLVLAGELDGGPRPDLARRAAAAFAHAEFALQPGAGHYPWLDDPRWFVRRVAAFLAGERAAPSPSAE
ncbi:alpha/beta hydrolase [Streptomyces sp. NPDC004042]|uniref:alpha/beta fold hydrolase n=1 Tax=Streptomyces sp. NPDC004042 TaxID=3154451 RepID=UPI0033ADEDB5